MNTKWKLESQVILKDRKIINARASQDAIGELEIKKKLYTTLRQDSMARCVCGA